MLTFLKSRKLALGVMVFLFIATVAGMVVPQESLMNPTEFSAWRSQGLLPAWLYALGLTNVFASWWYILGVVLLLGSLVVCVWSQLSAITGSPIREEYRWGRYGSAAFHVGLVLIILGFMVSQLAGLYGQVELTEEQAFTDDHGSYRALWEGPLFRERHSGLTFRVDRIDPWFTYKKFRPDVQTTVSAFDPQGTRLARKTIRLNVPLVVNGMSLNQGALSGYTVAIEDVGTHDKVGRPIRVNLNYAGRNRTDPKEFRIPGFNYGLRVILRPLPRDVDTRLMFPFPRPKRPSITVALTSGHKTVLWRKLGLGESLVYDGHKLVFSNLGFWSVFSVNYDPGTPVIEIGFLIGIAGLLLRFLWEPRQIRISVGGGDDESVVRVSAGDWFWLADEGSRYRRLHRELVSGLNLHIMADE